MSLCSSAVEESMDMSLVLNSSATSSVLSDAASKAKRGMMGRRGVLYVYVGVSEEEKAQSPSVGMPAREIKFLSDYSADK